MTPWKYQTKAHKNNMHETRKAHQANQILRVKAGKHNSPLGDPSSTKGVRSGAILIEAQSGHAKFIGAAEPRPRRLTPTSNIQSACDECCATNSKLHPSRRPKGVILYMLCDYQQVVSHVCESVCMCCVLFLSVEYVKNLQGQKRPERVQHDSFFVLYVGMKAWQQNR